MRIVGNQDRSEFELDPVKAWHRGRQLDALLATALPERPRGVWRAQHAELNRLDDEWQLAIARRVNASQGAPLSNSARPDSQVTHAA